MQASQLEPQTTIQTMNPTTTPKPEAKLTAWKKSSGAFDEPGDISAGYIGALLNEDGEIIAKCAKEYQPDILFRYNHFAEMRDALEELMSHIERGDFLSNERLVRARAILAKLKDR